MLLTTTLEKLLHKIGEKIERYVINAEGFPNLLLVIVDVKCVMHANQTNMNHLSISGCFCIKRPAKIWPGIKLNFVIRL